MVMTKKTLAVEYPAVWVRWVTAQVRIAVACELSTASRLLLPHLRRLPLTINAGMDDESYLRELITAAAERIPAEAGDRVDLVTAAVLADSAVSMTEPNLQTLLAWRLAAHHVATDKLPQRDDRDADLDFEHECFDPEAIAADLVGSGLIAPAWNRNVSETAARGIDPWATIRVARRTRRSAVSPLQLAFPA